MLKEWQPYQPFCDAKNNQYQESMYFAQMLPKYTINKMVGLTGLSEHHNLDLIRFDFICAFFFDSISFITYNMMYPNELTLLDFQSIFSAYLVGCYTIGKVATPENKGR